MFRKALLSILGLVFGFQAAAQKFAYVDSEYILKKVPEYNQAQRQLDQLSEQWQGEVEALYSEIDALRKAYQAEKVLLTEVLQKEREEQIAKKEKEAKELQRKYFGPEGELFKKRSELIKPIQDQVYNAVQEVARRRRLDIVFDKSSALIMLYTDPGIDISQEVLDKMGY